MQNFLRKYNVAKSRSSSLDDVDEKTINRQQFRKVQARLLNEQIQNELLVGLFFTIFVCAVFWNIIPGYILITWSVLVSVSLAVRSIFVTERFANPKNEEFSIWGKSYVYVSMFSGIIWGSLGLMAIYYGSESHQIFSFFILVVVSLTAYTSMQSSPLTFAVFGIPAVSPITIGLIHNSAPLQMGLSISAVLLFIVLFTSSKRMRVLLNKSIKLSTHNTDLIRNLVTEREATEKTKKELEVANEELKVRVEEKRIAEERMRESKEKIQMIFDGMQDVIFQADKKGTIEWVTPSIKHLLDYGVDEVIGRHASILYANVTDYEKHQKALDTSFGQLQHYEIMMKHKKGDVVWVSENSTYKYDEIGAITGYEATLRDITNLKQTKEALYLAQERAYVTLGSIGDGVIALDMDGRIEYMNIVVEQGTGWILEEAHGKQLSTVFKIVDEKTLKKVPDPVKLCLDEGKTIMLPGYLLLIHRHFNQRISIEVNASPIKNSIGIITGVVLVFHDVSELRSLAQMTYHATHDSLTDLINRREFEKRVMHALDNTRSKDKRYALCYLDLDNFKVVNDTCGHVAGDELLKQIAMLLRSGLREGDTISRLGGDEFGILFSGCSINSAKRLAENMRKIVEDFRFVWDDKSFRVGISIGLVPITIDSGTMSDILSAADSACYVAKEKGRNRIHIYEVNDSELMEQQGQMMWVQRIQDVLEKNRFQLYFQKIAPIDQSDGVEEKIHGEVLLRMLDDDDQLIGPGAFIPAAERYSLMPAIDLWVLENTLRILALDTEKVAERVGICSINLSGQSISDDRFVNYLIDMIDETGVSPNILCFEITETAVISNLSNASQLISTLRGMGCSFALDDFGVGLSSFSYLKNLAVDYLKLDGCFIKNMTKDSIDHAMVQSINHVGQTMNIKTIAEFVENEETIEALRKIGVNYAQGYQIARPQLLVKALYDGKNSNVSSVVKLKNVRNS